MGASSLVQGSVKQRTTHPSYLQACYSTTQAHASHHFHMISQCFIISMLHLYHALCDALPFANVFIANAFCVLSMPLMRCSHANSALKLTFLDMPLSFVCGSVALVELVLTCQRIVMFLDLQILLCMGQCFVCR